MQLRILYCGLCLLLLFNIYLTFSLIQNKILTKRLSYAFKIAESKYSQIDSLYYLQVKNVGMKVLNQKMWSIDKAESVEIKDVVGESGKLCYYYKYIDCKKCGKDVIQNICSSPNERIKLNTIIILPEKNKSFANSIRRISGDIPVFIIKGNDNCFSKISENCFFNLDSQLKVRSIFIEPFIEKDYFIKKYLRSLKFY